MAIQASRQVVEVKGNPDPVRVHEALGNQMNSPRTSRTPLFRAEAMSRQDRRFGTIILTQPTCHTALSLLAAGFIVAIVWMLSAFEVTRKARIPGELLPVSGLIRIVAPQSGIIVERRIHDGHRVVEGDVLFVLGSERTTATRGDAETAVGALIESRRNSFVAEREQHGRQVRHRAAALQRRMASLARESERIDQQIELQQRRLALAEEALKRSAQLQAANFISLAGSQDKHAEALDQRQRLNDLERSKAANALEQSTTRAELQDLLMQSHRDQLALERSIAQAEQDLTENDARRQVLVRSPRTGVATTITAGIGQAVSIGRPVATIVPDDASLEAVLYAPSRAAGFLKPGLTVLLRYQAYPYQKFGHYGGTIREVSNAATPSSELSAATHGIPLLNAGEPVYRVRVALDRQSITAHGSEYPLKSGMALDASVLLERRRLYEWVLEPLYSITGRV